MNKEQRTQPRIWKKLIFIFFIISLVFVFSSQNVHGQQTRTITITPPTIPITLDPGGKSEGTMGVINDSSDTVTFSVSVQDYTVEDTHGTPNILPPNTLSNKYSAASWIGVSPSSFTVPPHQRQELNYYIQTPPDAKPGGHYAAIVYNPANKASLKNTGATVNSELGTLFYVTINGPINQYAVVSKFLTNGFQEYGPVNILTEIKNLGDLHIRPLGSIVVRNLFGSTVATLGFDQHNIFPESARDYTNTFDSKFLIGRYKATLLLTYGTSNNLPLSATVYFWVFPWRAALVIVFIIIAIILALMLWRKKKKENKDVKQQVPQQQQQAQPQEQPQQPQQTPPPTPTTS